MTPSPCKSRFNYFNYFNYFNFLEQIMKRVLIFTACLALGCGAKVPPLSSESQAIVRKFEEHLPKHRTQLFEGLCKDVEKLHDTKKITDEEYAALHNVCGPASTGQWDRAQENLEPLKKAVSEKK
jgi:hypothetical protein